MKGRGVEGVAELEKKGAGGTKEALNGGVVDDKLEVGDKLEEGGLGLEEFVRTNDT